MTETALDRFWELLSGALTLNPKAFELIQSLPLGGKAALYVVLMAGLSQTVGQGIVLFANRVKPFRFFLSVLIAVILFAFSYGFWSLSTWLVSDLLFVKNASFPAVARTLGLAYAPQIFGFLVALAYFGVPLSVAISVWSLLSFVTGLGVTLGLTTWSAFWCCALGWAVFQLLQRTIGRPVSAVGSWLANRAAGVELVTDLKKLEQMVQQDRQPFPAANPKINTSADKEDNS